MAQEIATPADPIKAFQDKVTEKLKADIGALMPDEVLAGLVQRAVEEQFFKPRKIRDPSQGSYGDRVIDAPGWFVAEVATHAKPMIEAAVKRYVEEHKDEIDKAIKQFMSEQNLLLMGLTAMHSQVFNDFHILAGEIVRQMKGR